jgi:hypothetical protein
MIGGGEFSSFELLIQMAQDRKNQAKDAFLIHTKGPPHNNIYFSKNISYH